MAQHCPFINILSGYLHTGFALFAHLPVPAVAFMLGIGLVGVTMNPAMATRVQRAGNAGPLVNTIHSSFITLGIVFGTSAGGPAIDAFGLRAPLWIGAGMAAIGILTLVPALTRRPAGPSGPAAPPEGYITPKGAIHQEPVRRQTRTVSRQKTSKASS
ncbi:hypothetical protein [Streptomyces olivoreticuli]|uniref:hypothetical protein n=1 Tax=Streptomyces olivoreticuli TaxID=68246 RepID=UPI003F5CC6CF